MDLPKFQPGERVLVVRSAPVARVWAVLQALLDATPGIGIDLLVQGGVAAQFAEPRLTLLPIPDGMLTVDTLPEMTRAMLATRRHVCAIVVYNEPDGSRYHNVHEVLATFDLPQVIGVFPESAGDGLGGAAVGRGPDWTALRDRHAGRRAFVIGNGPSLQVADLSRLEGEITFASNKIYLAFDETRWRPSYYTICDHMVAANNAERTRMLDLPMLLPTTLRKFDCAGPRTLWYRERFENKFVAELPTPELTAATMHFSRDVADGLHGGYTVIYHQLQLAYFMGIREVYLIGVDFHFNVPTQRTEVADFASPVYRNAIVSQGERNHFHPDYRKPGETWTMPRLELQDCAFRSARAAFEREGGRLCNASRRTALEALPRADFDAIIGMGREKQP